METKKEIEYKSTIMEMRNINKNQERVIEEMLIKEYYSEKQKLVKTKNKTYEVGDVVSGCESKRY